MLEVVSRVTRILAAAARLGCIALCLVTGLACIALGRAQAQSCHTVASLRPTQPTSGLSYRVALTGTFGSFADAAVSGEYQGLLVSGLISHPWFSAELYLPGYRIAKTGSHDYGFGNPGVDVRGHVYRADDDTLIAGPELALTLPAGSSNEDLAMQHTMLMAGGFLLWQQGSYTVLAQLAYGRALTGGHAHGAGPMPLVSPMNRSELSHAIGASARIHDNLRVTGRLIGAVNLFDHNGAPRELVAPGLQLVLGPLDASLELQLPVVGKPFASRTLVSVGAQW